MREDAVTAPPAAGYVDAAGAPPRRGSGWLLGSVTVSSLGDGAYAGAVPVAAAALTREPAAVAAVAAAGALPWLLVTPVAGALVDRWPYRPVMLAADLARGAGLALLTVLVATGHASIVALAATSCLAVCGQIFHDTALQGVVPALTGRSGAELDRVNGRIYGAETAGQSLVGPPAGSASFAAWPWLPFLADTVSFVASAGLLARLPRGLSSGHHEHPALWRAIREGASWLARHHRLRTTLLVSSTANLAYAMAFSVFVLYATSTAGLDTRPAAFGLLVASYAVGGVVAGPLTARVTAHLDATRVTLIVSAAHAAAWPVIAVTHNPWAAAPVLAVIGAAQTMTTVCVVGLRQSLVPAPLLGRVTSAFRTVGNSATFAGAGIGGLIADQLGLRAPLFAAGAVLVTAVVTATALLRRL